MSSEQQQYPRFRVGARIEHIILLVSFTILAITGLPQRYAQSDWAQSMIQIMGGIETVRSIHRYAAFLLVLGSFYHLFAGAYRIYVRRERNRMLPDRKDVTDLFDYIKFNLGRSDQHPAMWKFNFGEKLEFWAVVWGTAIMAITGFMLWNPIATTNLLPGQFIPASKAAHSYEAVLAVLSIVIWHFYNVIIKHWNPSVWIEYYWGTIYRDGTRWRRYCASRRLNSRTTASRSDFISLLFCSGLRRE